MGWTLERFMHECKKFDPLLRARVSYADPSLYIIERKCRRESPCLRKPSERRGWDAWVQDRDGYVEVMRVRRELLGHQVFLELRAHDMWHYRGAGYYADLLEERERQEQARLDREQSDYLQAVGEEAYDRGMIMQGDIVSGFHSKVGGYEPGTTKDTVA
jgi:hypothetical protein